MTKFITAQEAAALVQDGMTLALGGFAAYVSPEELFQALGDRYATEGHPKGLTTVATVSAGSNTKDGQGMSRIKAPGLIDTMIAGHFANAPEIAELVGNNLVAGYALPMGVMCHLLRAIAAKAPAVVTPVGLGTFADPRVEGCKANQKAVEQGREVVSLVELYGEEYLAYKTFPIDICFIRGTYADENGNISMAHEGVGDIALEIASATHNSGGIVVVQVEEIVKNGVLPPKDVRIHNPIVDYVVKVADPAMNKQSFVDKFRPELSGQLRCPTHALPPMPLDNRKIIARRGALELKPGCLINLGVGIPSGVGLVVNEEGLTDQITLSLECGPQGGVPVAGPGFGASVNPECIYPMANMFDLYDGGVLDMSFLGAAEINMQGDVNVSKFGTRCTGPGGFVNISQNTKQVYFCGAFTAGGLVEEVRDGKLHIIKEGRNKKFLQDVQQITFSGKYATKTSQKVTFITERAVLVLTPEGLMLTEIAPGMDLERDILAQMDFAPIIAPDLKEMDVRIFMDAPMGLTLD